jgi:integrase
MPAQPSPPDRRMIPVEGHPGIYKRGNRFVVTWKHRGKPRKSFHRTLSEARRTKAKRVSGDTEPAARQRFDAYARAWIVKYQGRTCRGISDATRASYADALERFAIPHFGTARLGEITAPDFRDYITMLIDRDLASRTIRRYVAPLRAMFAQAVDDGHVRINPTAGVRVVVRGERVQRPHTLTPGEIKTLMEAIPGQWRELVWFLAFTGCRIGEALHATWGDVGQENGAPALSVPDSKTDAGVRAIPLSPDTNRMLLRRRMSAKYASDADPIFPSTIGAPLDARNWRRRVWRPAVGQAGIKATPHTLRHSLASLLFERGHTAAQVAAWLGHEDPSFTLRTYIHARDAGDATFLDAALGGNPGGNPLSE